MQSRRYENTSFSTSLYELDRMINEREDPGDDNVTLQEIRAKVPVQSQDYVDVFSKAASDQLPPHRSYDHRIQLLSQIIPLDIALSGINRRTNSRLSSSTYLRTLIKALLRLVKLRTPHLPSLLGNLTAACASVSISVSSTSCHARTGTLYLLLTRLSPELVKLKSLLSLIFAKRSTGSGYTLIPRS